METVAKARPNSTVGRQPLKLLIKGDSISRCGVESCAMVLEVKYVWGLLEASQVS